MQDIQNAEKLSKEMIKIGKKDKNEISQVKKYLRQSYILAAARGDEICSQLIQRVYKKEFNETILYLNYSRSSI